MNLDMNVCHEIIDDFNNDFDSHDFINAFIKKHPAEYLQMLDLNSEPFRKLNSEIARFLADNQGTLHIKKDEDKVLSENVKGNDSLNAYWHKDPRKD
ncbi:MAG: hypothetical protein J6X31_01195 [Bacteroidales bacterium]|nr:hypothetical protein [Bacteroidales bacterium]